jgi:hypothetical protein
LNKSYEDVNSNEVDIEGLATNRVRVGVIEGVETRKNARSKSIYHSVMPPGESPDILIIENIESYQTNKKSSKNESYNVGETSTIINKPVA